MNSTLQNAIIAAVGTIASLAVGFGVFGAETEQLVISSAGTLISLAFLIASEIKVNTKVKTQLAAAIAASDVARLKELSR
jgi:hypothetical protein